MGISEILMLLGGLALFLYGMSMMSDGLESTAGNKMKSILEKLTSNRFKGVLVGAAITAVIQSSSATTVMVVGFVNSGLMTLNQAVWIIMGANIGTTITGQLIALDIGAIAPLIAFIGVALITFVKNEKVRSVSGIFAGLGILFIGMGMMSDSMVPLRESQMFIDFVSNFNNPLLGILVGTIFTAVIQSSSAAVGILQALASTGVIPLSSAVFILFGTNIGTCITAVLASIGTKPNAKRTTLIHLMFNVFGTIIFTAFTLLTPFVLWMETLTPGNPVSQIANVHTVFNVVTTIILLPLGNYMAKLTKVILPETEKEEDSVRRLKYIVPFETKYIVGHSALVISQIGNEINRMLDMVKKNLSMSFDAAIAGTCSVALAEEIEDREEYIDYLNVEITRYISKLMSTDMPARDYICINNYYTISSNLERIGDHALNIEGYARNLERWNRTFSETAIDQIKEMKNACDKALNCLMNVTEENSQEVLEQIAKDEQKIDDMEENFRSLQLERMKNGGCQPESSLIFGELLTDFERIGDHALNVAEKYHGMYIV